MQSMESSSLVPHKDTHALQSMESSPLVPHTDTRTLPLMRCMEFCGYIYTRLEGYSGPNHVNIRMPYGDAELSIIFVIISSVRPRLLDFQPRGHPGFYPLSSLIQEYIRLGSVQSERGITDSVERMMKIIRNETFHYDRFADKVITIELVWKDSLANSFFYVFEWVSSPLMVLLIRLYSFNVCRWNK